MNINKQDYLNAKKIIEQFEKEQISLNGFALIYTEKGTFQVKKENLKDWLDTYFAKRLRNKPKKYSQNLWDKLCEESLVIDGEEFVLPRYDEDLLNKWF